MREKGSIRVNEYAKVNNLDRKLVDGWVEELKQKGEVDVHKHLVGGIELKLPEKKPSRPSDGGGKSGESSEVDEIREELRRLRDESKK